MSELNSHDIEQQLKKTIGKASEIRVAFDGSKAHIIVVLAAFSTMGRLEKQQLIYSALADEIADGRIHAVTMETLTPEEWVKVRPFR